MASAYTIFAPPAPGTPEGLDVRIVVMRRDGRNLTRAQLEALFVAYPPPEAQREDVRAGIDTVPGPVTAPSPKAARSTAKPPKAKPATRPTTKRKAAKRPAR